MKLFLQSKVKIIICLRLCNSIIIFRRTTKTNRQSVDDALESIKFNSGSGSNTQFTYLGYFSVSVCVFIKKLAIIFEK